MAQKTTYNLPKTINKEQASIIFQKISTSNSSYYVNYKARNNSNSTLIVDRSLTSLEQNDGELHPISKKYIVKPGESKIIYNQFRIKPPVKPNQDHFKLNLNGISYASPSAPFKAKKLVISEKAIQTIECFTIKILEFNTYPDRVYANVKCTYNGDANHLGKIDLTKLNVNGGKAKVVKKGDVIFPGKTYSFSVNITPNGEELSLDFNDVLQDMSLEKISIEQITIKSTTYVEPVNKTQIDSTETAVEKIKKDTVKVAELSYSDMVALKKDIELEMNNGGKPIDMAFEFLMEKGGISTIQIIDIISIFNLDGSRLKFAKMAYQYTSDKAKYHMIVAKLAYTKNKQALEEFLEQQ